MTIMCSDCKRSFDPDYQALACPHTAYATLANRPAYAPALCCINSQCGGDLGSLHSPACCWSGIVKFTQTVEVPVTQKTQPAVSSLASLLPLDLIDRVRLLADLIERSTVPFEDRYRWAMVATDAAQALALHKLQSAHTTSRPTETAPESAKEAVSVVLNPEQWRIVLTALSECVTLEGLEDDVATCIENQTEGLL